MSSYCEAWLRYCWAMRVLKDCNWAKTKVRRYLEELRLKQRPETVEWLREELLRLWQHKQTKGRARP